MMNTRAKYMGGTPGADSNTYNLFSTAGFPARNMASALGLKTLALDLRYTTAGTLKFYKSQDVATPTWRQIGEYIVLPPFSTNTYRRDFDIGSYQDFKVDWVNGGAAQTSFEPDLLLTPEVSQKYEHNYTLGTTLAFGADYTSGWIDCQGFRQMQVTLFATTAVTAEIYLQGTNDPARVAIVGASNSGMAIPAAALHAAGTGIVLAGTAPASVSVTLSSDTGPCIINVSDLMQWQRFFVDRSAGGGNDGEIYVSLKY